jgi:hypothetical protein
VIRFLSFMWFCAVCFGGCLLLQVGVHRVLVRSSSSFARLVPIEVGVCAQGWWSLVDEVVVEATLVVVLSPAFVWWNAFCFVLDGSSVVFVCGWFLHWCVVCFCGTTTIWYVLLCFCSWLKIGWSKIYDLFLMWFSFKNPVGSRKVLITNILDSSLNMNFYASIEKCSVWWFYLINYLMF